MTRPDEALVMACLGHAPRCFGVSGVVPYPLPLAMLLPVVWPILGLCLPYVFGELGPCRATSKARGFHPGKPWRAFWFQPRGVRLPPIAMTTAVPGKPNRHPLSDVGPIRLSESHAESFGVWWWFGKGEAIARQRAFLSHSEAST
jgi:hypothetical protein